MDEIIARLRVLEDRAEIAELIAQYGPIVDSGSGQHLRNIWTADGKYVVGSEFEMKGESIPDLTNISGHQEYMRNGCGHILSAPTITIEGDNAKAVNHSMLVLRDGERWVVERLSANRWTFVRTEKGWRVTLRENDLLNGNKSARALLEPESST